MLLYVMESPAVVGQTRLLYGRKSRRRRSKSSHRCGIMEHKFVEMAKEQLGHFATAYSIHKQYHDKETARHQSGMICSGDQTILLYKLLPENITPVNKIITCLTQNQQGILQLSPLGLRFTAEIHGNPDYHATRCSQSWTGYTGKRSGIRILLYIIGGGHCALALSEVMQKLDFYVHIFEDRPHLHTLLENSTAHRRPLYATTVS